MSCSNCGAPALPGSACPTCGTFQPAMASGPGDGPGAGQGAGPGGAPAAGGITADGVPVYGPGQAGAPGGVPPAGQMGPGGLPAYGQGYGQGYGPGYGPAGYGTSQYGAPYQYPPPQPYSPYQPPSYLNYPQRPRPNGLAIASLVCSCCGVLCWGFTSILGIIFGFVAKSQIRRSQGQQTGNGLATAGIIVGFVVVGLAVAAIVVDIVLTASNSS